MHAPREIIAVGLTHFARGCVTGVVLLLCMSQRLAFTPQLVAGAFCCAISTITAAEPAEPKLNFDLPRGDAATTLSRFASMSRRQIIFMMDKVRGEQTNAVVGEYSPREALDRMLAGTALIALEDRATGGFVIKRVSATAPAAPSQAQPESKSAEANSQSMKRKSLFTAIAAWFTLALQPTPMVQAADGIGARTGAQNTTSITGRVSNAETGNALQGAVVSIPGFNRREITDSAGRFALVALPPGTHELVVSYTGLVDERRLVAVETGEKAVTFELRPADIITLEKFTVSTEREGNALADSNQRNASNIKNVMAMDAFGNMPSTNVGDNIMRLPGVAATFDNFGRVNGISVRGMPIGMTSMTIDGIPALRGQQVRETDITGLTGGDFEQIELIKGHTPDQSANSLGGSVNLKTASPLNMSEKRRFTYSVFAKWAPPFLEQWSGRLQHPVHPIVNLSYQEAFDVGSERRNLGVSFSLYYIEQTASGNNNFYVYNNAPQGAAYLYDFRDASIYVNKHVLTPSLRLEYRPSGVSRFQLGLLYNKEDTADNSNGQFRAFTSQSVATIGPDGRPTGTGTILPGYSETRTQVRGLTGSIVQMTSNVLSFYAKTPSVNFAGEHKLGRWEVDYKLAQSDSHVDAGHGNSGPKGNRGEGGALTLQARNIGWIVDRTDPSSPRFTQTEGPSIYDVATYTDTIQHIARDLTQDNQIRTAELNTSYSLPGRLATVVKGGFSFEQRINSLASRNSRQFNRVAGAPALPSARIFKATSFDDRHGGRLPMVDARATNLELSNRSLWTEDLYYSESQRLSGTRKATERVNAGYMMFRSRINRLQVLGGTRVESTTFLGEGNLKRASATAAQIPDPIARARHDWSNYIKTKGEYTRSFPSVHLAYDLHTNLKARASWSTSIGRPAHSVMMPTATANDNTRTVTTSNPALGPQYAKNIDLTLEYYFKPAGYLRAGYFEKDIKDYILTTLVGTVASGGNNGFGGDYAGYDLLSQRNAGRADVRGWELDYRQQLLFLPGFLKGFELGGNYTSLKTKGNFGGTENRTTSEVPGFTPRTANVSLGYTYRKFGTRMNYSYMSDYLRTFNAQPALRVFTAKLNVATLSVFYALKPNMTISADMANVFAERRASYQYVPSRTSQIFLPSQTISIGLRGRF